MRIAITWLSSRLVEGAAPSPLAGHAVNPSMGLDGGIHAATRSRNRRGHHARQLVGGFVEKQRHRVAACESLLKSMQTDHLDWSLPAHRRGTLGGMDAATELHGRTCS
ncbi:hypothetical protein, partial [Xanthomonas arboricola]